MIIFLYGADSYRAYQKLNEIVEGYKKTYLHRLNLKFFDFEKDDFRELRDQFQQKPIFKGKKLFVLRNCFSQPHFKEEFLKEAEVFRDSEDLILIYENKKIPENDPLFKFLIENGKSQEFRLLEGGRLIDWLKKEFNKEKIEIEPAALKLLIDYVGNDLWQMSNEIKKLVSYKKGQKIRKKEIELLVSPKIETDIFRTIDSLASKNKKKALELIHQHLEKGESPLYLLSMINFQFRNLLLVKEFSEREVNLSQLSSKIALHPYLIKKSLEQAKKFSFPELKKIYQKIFQLDYQIKTGKIEPKLALDIFITEI